MSKRNTLFQKIVLILPALLFLIVLSFHEATLSPAAEQGLPVRVLVNGSEVDFPDARPLINENDRVLAPARFVARELGAKVAWDGETATAHISGHGKSIDLVAGRNTAAVNGEEVSLDSGAVLTGGRIYVPVRFLAETLGAAVQWDEGARAVRITMELPIIKDFGISYTRTDGGWYVLPRTFTAWVASGNVKKVDFYLTPTGTGQEPVKIATSSYGSGGYFSITYILPQESTLAHFWAVAVNDKGEESTETLNVYREAADRFARNSIGFGELSLSVYNQDLHFAPGGKMAVFSGYSHLDEENKGQKSKLLLLDLAEEAVSVLDEGDFIRTLGWDAGGENVLYMKDRSLYRLFLKEGKKNLIAEDCFYGSFSPDGQKIAFARRNSGLWICDPDGGGKRRLTNTSEDWYPIWYPDGEHLFYFSDLGQELGDGAGHLQGMAEISLSDGSIEALLPQKTGKFRRAEWIVPGRSLHVISGWDDGLYQHIVDLAEGKITDLGENFGDMNYTTAVDTSAGRLLKACADGNVQIYNGSGNLLKSIEQSFQGWLCLSAAFSPDGRSVLVMNETRAGGQVSEKKEIAVMDCESGSYNIVAEGGENFEACFWEPGSGMILILEKSAAGSSYRLIDFTRMAVKTEPLSMGIKSVW